MEAKGQKFLKISGILFIIWGVFGLIGSFVTLAAGGLITVGGMDATEGAVMGMSLGSYIMLISVISIIIAAIELVAGVIGVKNSKKIEKAQVCFILGIVVLGAQVVSAVFSMLGGLDASTVFSIVLGLAISGLYIFGAISNKKSGATPVGK